MEPSAASILVGYGTETGISYDIAEQVSRMAMRLHLKVELCEMNRIQLSSLLRKSLVIFVVSTTGLGDMPKNAAQLWKRLLRKKLAPRCLSGVRFAVFGLGDSSYQQFNWASLKLSKRLGQLGASEVFPRGEADQQHPDGIDQAFIPWISSLREFLLQEFPLPPETEPIPESKPLPPTAPLIFMNEQATSPSEPRTAAGANTIVPSSADITPDEQLTHKFGMMDISTPASAAPSNVPLEMPSRLSAKLTLNQRITPTDHWQDVRLLRFQISPESTGWQSQLPAFMPGDTLDLYAKNFPVDVDNLIKWMGWDEVATKLIDWSRMGAVPSDLPKMEQFTLRDLLLHSLDIFAVPSRTFFEKLSYLATDEEQKTRLLEFSRPEFTDEYYDYASRPRRSILEVLQEFDTVRIPADAVLDIFPAIRPRQYSIANWPRTERQTASKYTATIELVVALVKYRTVLRRVRRGLVSRYLENLAEGTDMYVSYTQSSSKISGPENARRPLVCIATGTGIAPIRSLVQERGTHGAGWTAETAAKMAPETTTDLYFGCRNRESDFHFGKEWQKLAQAGQLALHTAFSRDAQTKVYVQDVLRSDKERLAGWVKSDAIFFVCGGSRKMADAVKALVKEAMVEYGGVEAEQDVDIAFRGVSWVEEIW
ncbi:hypothetical protein BROUX41_002205 [Berkeleyomyces rouxiae]|uniref:uncharacterized protein n=1 Tax=Berkeleyomyces rouxiae TaxID=2035830 RepID=UPI003B7D0B43